MNHNLELLYQNLITKSGKKIHLKDIHQGETGSILAKITEFHDGPVLVITKDIFAARSLEQEISFFGYRDNSRVVHTYNLPDWETLPYDQFSPHQDIISERLLTLYNLPKIQNGAIIISINTLLQYLPPRDFLESNSFVLKCKEKLNLNELRKRLEKFGFRCVTEVMEHGEFAVRGSLFDVFPMGSPEPYRIDLFDDIVDSIRIFDPDTQISSTKINEFRILPAKEFPLTSEAISFFRNNWYTFFNGDPALSSIYQNISRGESAPGIEYYLRLFFEHLATLFDYLPKNLLVISIDDIHKTAENFWQEIKNRHDELCHDNERPILPPKEIFLTVDKLFNLVGDFKHFEITTETKNPFPNLAIDHKKDNPLADFSRFLQTTKARVLVSVESLGRRESLLNLFKKYLSLEPKIYSAWQDFTHDNNKFGLVVANLSNSAYLQKENIALITENLLFGTQVLQRSPGKHKTHDPNTALLSLTELGVGDPVTHLEHGVGRYLGLTKLTHQDQQTEFLTIEYTEAAKLYVPVTSLHLISRYSGANSDTAPLNRLGGKQWEKAKRETLKKVRDVAVELLNIYAKRAAKQGFRFSEPDASYEKFARAFPFEETVDQKNAILATIADMTSTKTMDRLICGDVGFGKTEVAMRAAFIAVTSGKQVAILAPTTLLTEQHYQNFLDRFADFPVKIEMLSRFRDAKQQTIILNELKEGKIDIIIGTHKLLQPNIIFKDLGLLVIDEEHRFGVKQKERIKALRANIDILTLTATPIPRTLNMALSGMRDFSIIGTPPPGRLAIKTFIQEKNSYIIREAIQREIMRGGQVYFLHNEVATISHTAEELEKIIPEARIGIAHGQMRERELEKIMTDFYHQRFNVLVCTTIIESGIDLPSANTIIINRADKLGLAQLHQLRGRVGRSHHQAYAYLLTPPYKTLTSDAKKRLDALASLGALGIGFALATHDLEIRGAGELLGEEQSGQIAAIGFDLYVEYLEKALAALKNGETFDLENDPLQQKTEIDLQIPAVIPDLYLGDINLRLILYKRIASAKNNTELDDLQIEMINRFGLLPKETKNLFGITEIKLLAEPLGVKKIIANLNQGSIEFTEHPKVDLKKIISLVQKEPNIYKLKGGNKILFSKKHSFPENLIDFVKKLLCCIM